MHSFKINHKWVRKRPPIQMDKTIAVCNAFKAEAERESERVRCGGRERVQSG